MKVNSIKTHQFCLQEVHVSEPLEDTYHQFTGRSEHFTNMLKLSIEGIIIQNYWVTRERELHTKIIQNYPKDKTSHKYLKRKLCTWNTSKLVKELEPKTHWKSSRKLPTLIPHGDNAKNHYIDRLCPPIHNNLASQLITKSTPHW